MSITNGDGEKGKQAKGGKWPEDWQGGSDMGGWGGIEGELIDVCRRPGTGEGSKWQGEGGWGQAA